MVAVCERAADALAGEASVEVLDLRTLEAARRGDAARLGAARPAAASSSRRRRGRAGFAAEIAALLAERAILDLHGPVLRVTGYDVPYPYWQLEDWYMPSVERVVDARAPGRRLLDVPSAPWRTSSSCPTSARA